jgi:hypothetical protein
MYQAQDAYSEYFDFYLDGREDEEPELPELSPGSNHTSLLPTPDFNCPWQSYDCSARHRETQSGQAITVIQHTPSVLQSYPALASLNVTPVVGPTPTQACRLCSKAGLPCPPVDVSERRRFDACVCSSDARDLPEEAAVQKVDSGWIVHLHPGIVLSSANSISHLLSFARTDQDLLLFAFAEDGRAQQIHGRKRLDLADMAHLGFAYHSDYKGYSRWSSPSTDCGKFASIESLSRVLARRWIPLSVVIAQPDPYAGLSEKVTVFVHGNSSRMDAAIAFYGQDSLKSLIAKVVAIDGSESKGLEKLAKTDGVLLVDATLRLEQVS